MKIVCMPAKDDMSSLLRVTWPAQILQEQGADIEILDTPWMVREHQRRILDVQAPECDVLVLCRPQHEMVAKSIPLLQKHGIAVVVDYDDDLTAVHTKNTAWAAHNQTAENWRWALEAANLADLVTVSTPALLDVYAPHGRGIVLPNRLPSGRIPLRAEYSGKTRLGWAGFIGTHPTDLTVMGGAATKVLHGRMQPFHVVGPAAPELRAQLGGCQVRATGLIDKDDWLPTIAATLDVGIAPAERSAFNLGKSCLKSIEGAAAGVAMIASPTPDNRRAAADGLCVLAEDKHQWMKLMRLFLDNDQARAEQVEAATAGLQKHLMEGHVEDWADAWGLASENRYDASYSQTMVEQGAH